MVNVLVVTLGKLAESLLDSSEHIIGSADNVAAHCLDWNEDVATSRAELVNRVCKMDRGQGVIVLTDMFGGTSTNIALKTVPHHKIEVVTGVNLPMIITAVTLPVGIELARAAELLRNQGKKSITVASQLL